MSRRLAFVNRVWDDMITRGGIEKTILSGLKITQAREGLVMARLPIERQHTNRLGIIHGGVLSTLVDVGGSLAMASHGFFMTGVTTDLASTFLRAGGKPGQELDIRCLCQRLGRTMAFTFVEVLEPDTHRLLVRGNHTKYIAAAWKSDQNVEFTADE